jgi:uncharacterized protein YaiI (UPF0178 family)
MGTAGKPGNDDITILVADNKIIRRLGPGDLVITADIPLAAEAIAKGGFALNPRGEFYSEANIRERLDRRDFMDTLRSSGIQTGSPAALNQRFPMSWTGSWRSGSSRPDSSILSPDKSSPRVRKTTAAG